MINLDVYFNDNLCMDGQAILEENLITNECRLNLKTKLFIHETRFLIDKAKKILNERYNTVNVNVHWESCGKENGK